MIHRRASRPISIGGVRVGGDAPIVVQSMTRTDTRDIPATLRQIAELAEAGCELVRVAVPDSEAAGALPELKRQSPVPLIADIHFDYRLALEALGAGMDGLRLNPGNIGGPERVKKVVRAAGERGVPIRVGVNAGSMPARAAGDTLPQRMVAAALKQIALLESLDFDLIKVSLKAFDVPTTVEAYRLMAQRAPYPLHLGITEAGIPPAGSIRSAVGLGIMLWEGIGDTIRVSLTAADPREEVEAAYEILKSLDLREHGPTLVSCPSCGRCESDFIPLARAVEERLRAIKEPVKVAVMGCEVNGPGEARDADVGIACGRGRGVIFRKGRKLRTVPEAEYLGALMAEVEGL